MTEQELSERLTIDQCARKLTALNITLKMWQDMQTHSPDPDKKQLASDMIAETQLRISLINTRATELNTEAKSQDEN